jgi:hypothetical protein
MSTDKTTTQPTATMEYASSSSTTTSHVIAKNDENKRPCPSVLVATNVLPPEHHHGDESPLKKCKASNPGEALSTAEVNTTTTTEANTTTMTTSSRQMNECVEAISEPNSVKTVVDSNSTMTICPDESSSSINSTTTGLASSSTATSAAETKKHNLETINHTDALPANATTGSSSTPTTDEVMEIDDSSSLHFTAANAVVEPNMSNTHGTTSTMMSNHPMENSTNSSSSVINTSSNNSNKNVDSSSKEKNDNNYHEEDENVVNDNDDPHDKHRRAMETTRVVLQKLQTTLDANPQFCSEQRHVEWNDEIQHRLQRQSCPQTTIGVLGNTGVGKYVLHT